ncbi:GGDEF domain-containing protein (plasmid) [Methylobacterium sp. NMS12]|uniref:GGDEF domain-containing protein n=1 Tax=Methylobacterium sp. NMS12 TaxID=3079766 RepID=UPI003F8821CB
MTILAVADIDDFKAINDMGGHGAGDEVLRAFASFASASLGPRERIGRLGGDEFLLLLEAETPEAGRARIAAVHRRLTVGLGSSATPVMVSMGALVIPPSTHPEWTSAMRAADEVMYAVKASGKNGLRIETAGTIRP